MNRDSLILFSKYKDNLRAFNYYDDEDEDEGKMGASDALESANSKASAAIGAMGTLAGVSSYLGQAKDKYREYKDKRAWNKKNKGKSVEQIQRKLRSKRSKKRLDTLKHRDGFNAYNNEVANITKEEGYLQSRMHRDAKKAKFNNSRVGKSVNKAKNWAGRNKVGLGIAAGAAAIGAGAYLYKKHKDKKVDAFIIQRKSADGKPLTPKMILGKDKVDAEVSALRSKGERPMVKGPMPRERAKSSLAQMKRLNQK